MKSTAVARSTLAWAVAGFTLTGALRPMHRTHAQTPPPAEASHRIHLPMLMRDVARNGATVAPNVPNPTAAPPAPTWPDEASDADCDVRCTTDSDGDGAIDSIERYHNNARGQVTFYADDDGADGTDDWVTRSVYRADGELLSSEHDENGDGTIDTVQRIAWGGPGGRWIQSLETDEPGAAHDSVMQYTFTGRNMTLVGETRSGGQPASWMKMFYEADQVVRMEADFTGDDVAESTIHVVWEGGRRVEERARTQVMGTTIEQLYRYRYDASGRLVEERSGASEAKWCCLTTYRYGSDGFLAHRENLDISQSPPVLRDATDFAYAGGRLARIDQREAGEQPSVRILTYRCAGDPPPGR
ncbi:MAG: hypothetical protein U0470_04420 [Anaerolineae bacterium]